MDIQWGNHDLVWMGAAAGNETCIATVIRLSLRYANLNTLEDGYGINMIPLATFAMEVYENDPCTPYIPKLKYADVNYDERNVRLISQMHKAISIIQWKLEHSLFERNPEWKMEFRDRLHLVDQERGVVTIDGVEYQMKDPIFPTVSKDNPYELTAGERDLMDIVNAQEMITCNMPLKETFLELINS
jgi:fructose-1,6-bisphosphatase-3